MRLSRSDPRRAAFTLIELLVSMAVLALVISAMGMVQIRTQQASKVTLTRTLSEMAAQRALDRIVGELTGVGRSLIFPDPVSNLGTSALTYQHPTGVNAAGVVQWDTPCRLELQLEPGEMDNGIDDDGDGLVDERRLVLTKNFGTANARAIVLCSGIPELLEGETANGLDDNGNGLIDEPGFCVQRVGDLLTIHLTVQRARGGGQIETSTVQTSIVLHN
jgi:prepilin-type N-terminal cleavage/methylation domain-containing protein